MRQVFQQEEAEQVLREAVRRDVEQRSGLPGVAASASVGVTEDRLREMAQELGVSPQVLESVLRDRTQERDAARLAASEQQSRQEFITERRAGFAPHLYSYVGVNVLLFLIYLLTHVGYPWFLWPLLVWGLGLYFHAIAALPTRGAMFEKGFMEWKAGRARRMERQIKRAQKEAHKSARQRAEAEIEEM